MATRVPAEVTKADSLGGRYAAKHGIEAYRAQYDKGWRDSGKPRLSERGPWHMGTSTDAYDDGYLDRAAGREKWHLTRCLAHHNGDGGCHEA